jgi:hypothetical protein
VILSLGGRREVHNQTLTGHPHTDTMRRKPGIAGIKKNEEFRNKFNEKRVEIQQTQIRDLTLQLDKFKELLTEL